VEEMAKQGKRGNAVTNGAFMIKRARERRASGDLLRSVNIIDFS
jgi:hypothetical protein